MYKKSELMKPLDLCLLGVLFEIHNSLGNLLIGVRLADFLTGCSPFIDFFLICRYTTETVFACPSDVSLYEVMINHNIISLQMCALSQPH